MPEPIYIIHFPQWREPQRISGIGIRDLFRQIEILVMEYGPFDLLYRVQ